MADRTFVVGNKSLPWIDDQVIIGDGITRYTLQGTVTFLDHRVIIGKTLFGKPINVTEVLQEVIQKEAEAQKDAGNSEVEKGIEGIWNEAAKPK